MVFLTPNPSRVLAACCKVEVINGAAGLERVGLSSRETMLYGAPCNFATLAMASASFVGLYSTPFCLLTWKRMASSASDFK